MVGNPWYATSLTSVEYSLVLLLGVLVSLPNIRMNYPILIKKVVEGTSIPLLARRR